MKRIINRSNEKNHNIKNLNFFYNYKHKVKNLIFNYLTIFNTKTQTVSAKRNFKKYLLVTKSCDQWVALSFARGGLIATNAIFIAEGRGQLNSY